MHSSASIHTQRRVYRKQEVMEMGRTSIPIAIGILLINIVCCFSSLEALDITDRQTYVVYLGGHYPRKVREDELQVVSSHYELLASVLGSKEAAKESIFYSYTKNINGFAAHLEEEHAKALAELPGVVSVFRSQGRSILHTTDSWRFLGLEDGKFIDQIVPAKNLWNMSYFGLGIIIGSIDTGVWPESPSFDDKQMGSIPYRWKGVCQTGTRFDANTCNKKLIGARYFDRGFEAAKWSLNSTDFRSPRDRIGHGTHTLSTAGGAFVEGVNFNGLGEGKAKGGAPNATVAAYKICWLVGEDGHVCDSSDIIAAFDEAISDGVDVISISLGFGVSDYFQDAVAIGAFHAVQNRVVVVCSAGNDGFEAGSVQNVAPWIITVGASSIDRDFVSTVRLGNNNSYVGQSLTKFYLPEVKDYPLVSSLDAKAPGANDTAGRLCFMGALDPAKVQGKIVACLRGINDRIEKGEAVRIAGGVGMILCNSPDDGNQLFAELHVLPATHLNAVDGAAVLDYIKNTPSPVAYIAPPETVLNTKPAPVMTEFSSRGPNSQTPDILKPDITAPGLNIIAAYPTEFNSDNRDLAFEIMSGTSMSSPHVSGIVALLKGAQPLWSPAALRSAIMTTATRMDNVNGSILNSSLGTADPFNYGAGHVNPTAAVNPGLVYDLSTEDYLLFLCTLKYNSTQMKAVTGTDFSCPSNPPQAYDLNYPSITVSKLTGSILVNRTVTNVGDAPQAVYVSNVKAPPGVGVTIQPEKLEFTETGQKISFTVNLQANDSSCKDKYVFGYLTWTDGEHVVTSPIVTKC